MPKKFKIRIRPCRQDFEFRDNGLTVNRQILQQACETLEAGGIIAYPTEAVWGLGCDPQSYSAVKRILALKGRSQDKGLILVAAGVHQLGKLFDGLNARQLGRIEASWPGPTTWLIPDPAKLFPDWIKGKHQSIAIRVSAHPLVHALCEQFGKPIVSTSANAAGKTAIRDRTEIETLFGGSIDYVVAGDLGADPLPSEIRDLLSGSLIR